MIDYKTALPSNASVSDHWYIFAYDIAVIHIVTECICSISGGQYDSLTVPRSLYPQTGIHTVRILTHAHSSASSYLGHANVAPFCGPA